LSLRVHAFAVCEIQEGYQLDFNPMEAVTIHYVLAGNGVVKVGSSTSVSFSPDCVVVVPARTQQSIGDGSLVQLKKVADERYEIIADGILKLTAGEGTPSIRVASGMIFATYGGTLGFFEHLNGPIAESAEAGESLRYAFQRMVAELANPGIGTRALTEALMKQSLILLLRQHLVHHGVDSPFFAVLQDRRLARAVAAILERPAAPHTLDSLAHLAAMSRSSFSERFVKVFGQSPIDFLHKVRLRHAAHLLATTDLPVRMVAKSIGYGSRSYFSRAFRAAYGQDPTGFRVLGASPQDEPQADRSRTNPKRV
jgi:AraC-like DNA-binding protein